MSPFHSFAFSRGKKKFFLSFLLWLSSPWRGWSHKQLYHGWLAILLLPFSAAHWSVYWLAFLEMPGLEIYKRCKVFPLLSLQMLLPFYHVKCCTNWVDEPPMVTQKNCLIHTWIRGWMRKSATSRENLWRDDGWKRRVRLGILCRYQPTALICKVLCWKAAIVIDLKKHEESGLEDWLDIK